MKKEEEKSINPQSVDDFLKENVEEAKETQEVKFKRFKSPFIIRELSATETDEMRKRCTKTKRNKRSGQTISDTDEDKLSKLLMAESVVSPNLNNAELQKSYGIAPSVDSAIKTLYAMLTAGEFANLSTAINLLNGFITNDDDDDEGSDDSTVDGLAEQAKK